MNGLQLTLTFKKSMWNTPSEYKDLSNATEIAIDLETRDDGINEKLGAGWALGKGEIVGFAVAVDGWQGYFPFGHLGGGNLIPEQVKKYMKDVCALPCAKVFHNTLNKNGPNMNYIVIKTLLDEFIGKQKYEMINILESNKDDQCSLCLIKLNKFI